MVAIARAGAGVNNIPLEECAKDGVVVFNTPGANANGVKMCIRDRLRSAYYLVTSKNPEPDAFRAVRGMDGWKEAEFNLAGTILKVAVASGLGNTRKLMKALRKGRVSYDFVEIMACPGGCAGGGGQPIHDGGELAGDRGQILYGLDKVSHIRFSHENPSVIKCYEDFLEKPLSHKAHELLHTDHNGWKMPGET